MSTSPPFILSAPWKMTNICPACESGRLQPQVSDETMQYSGQDLLVTGVQFSRCPICAEEVVLPEQAKRNEVSYADAKREHDGLLASREIRAWRGRMRISQLEASTVLGGGANAFSKYERGETMQSRSMDLLIRVCDRFPDVMAFLADRAGLEGHGHGWETLYVEGESLDSQSLNVARLRRSCSQAIPTYRVANEGQWRADPETAYGYA